MRGSPAVCSRVVGGWLFRHRGWLPVPLFAACLLPLPHARLAGFVLLALGEGLRLWAVGHIGRKSRTRDDRVGALSETGPYARLRNPLYVGNLLLWSGIGVLAWPSALWVVPALVTHYSFIVRWEEAQLERQLGEPYRDYLRRVPRWLPLGPRRAGRWDGGEALRSERGTFAVLSLVGAALWARCYLPL